MIYGYNKTEKLFYAIGKTKNKLFEPYAIPFDEYIDAVLKRKDNKFNLNFVKFNEEFKVELNYPKIYNGIYDYINSKNKDDGIIPVGDAVNYKYGLDCYRDFCKSLGYMHDYRNYIEPLSYAVLLDHHTIMQMRIEYLKESGVVGELSITKDYKYIYEKAKEVYNYCLEYNNSFDPDLIKKIYIAVNQIITDEEQILNRLLLQIKRFLKE